MIYDEFILTCQLCNYMRYLLPHVVITPDGLKNLLLPIEENSLEFTIKGYPG